MQLLIVKRGALGDVVRTSYFSKAIKSEWGKNVHLTWLTQVTAEPLLRFNPYIDRIVISFDELA